ncbi:MAG: IMP dehydrogenase, partial [Alphaproteobacteria bacterium]
RLGLAADSAIPAYEDWAHFMLIEQKLPLDVTPEDNTLDDPAQRQRLMRIFDQGLRPPVGYVLPVLVAAGDDGRHRFLTERWAFRRGRLFLVPGDSPVGLRLPLGSLSEITFLDYP